MTQAFGCTRTSELDFRQLRHQTKNALTRILAQIADCTPANDSSRRVANELERRILLTAEISDALFGLTRAPGPLGERLENLCRGIIELASDPDQYITLECSVRAHGVPHELAETILRVAHELVGNAVKHGMHMRLVGRISVQVALERGGVQLEVSDNGWGCGREPCPGEGMTVAAMLAEQHGGRVALRRRGELTVATLWLPLA